MEITQAFSEFSLFFSSSATTHDLSLLTPFTLSTTKHQHCHRDTISPLSLFIGMYKSLSISLPAGLPYIFGRRHHHHHHMGCQEKLDICGATSAIDLDDFMRCVCP
jgi:hypothetical protein